jgi:hypothetical protein
MHSSTPSLVCAFGATGRNPLKVASYLHQQYTKRAADSRAKIDLHSAGYGIRQVTYLEATEFELEIAP